MTDTAAVRPAVDWNATVAANIRAELSRRGLNQAQAATALGMTEMWVSRRLSAKAKTGLDADDIKAFADFLGVPVANLFESISPVPTGSSV